MCAQCAPLFVKSTDHTDWSNHSSSIHFLIKLSFDCSGCMCSLDTDLGLHLTLWSDCNDYVTYHLSKCNVFVLPSFACTAHHISLFSTLPLASVVIIWYLVFPIIFIRAYLTFPKAVVLILKHATFLRPFMLPGPALIQADLGYQKAHIAQKIQQHVIACKEHSVEMDKAFIMAVEIGSSVLQVVSVWNIQSFYFQLRCNKCSCIRWNVSWNRFWNSHSHIWNRCAGVNVRSVYVVEPYVIHSMVTV